MNSCATCRFWHGDDEREYANCRRYPLFVERHGGDLCGEFKLKPELEPCVECGKPAGDGFRLNPRENALDIPGHLSRALMISPVCQECYDKLQAEFWRMDGDKLVPKK